MCGRFQISWPFRDLVALYGLARAIIDHDIIPRLNVGPTYLTPVIRQDQGQRVGVQMRWGYPATWLAAQGKDPWSRVLVNAKGEDAAKKRSWSSSLRQRRCLVPASGFYEWLRVGKKRYPLLFERADGQPMAFAGIWKGFDKDGETVDRYAILTHRPNTGLGQVHDRGPVILDPDAWDRWLDPTLDADGVDALVQPMRDGLLAAREVSTRLGSIQNTDGGLLEPDWRWAQATDKPPFPGLARPV